MSKNLPVPPSASVSSLEQVGRNKKSKRKISRVRLPTPPPDPTTKEIEMEIKKPVAEKTEEFLEYLDNLQKGSPQHNLLRTNSLFAPVIATEDAFDHLDKLYKLMEQMLFLREQNAKLHRRVRDLEHFRKIQNIEKYVDNVSNADVSDIDSALAENLLDTILSDSKRDAKSKAAHQFRFRQSILRKQRHNSASVSIEKQPIDMEKLQDSYRRTSALTGSDKKVSKWTKVKAAFRWEKASQTVSDVKSQDSGIGGMQPVNCEVARYLRVPSASEDPGVSPSDSGACEISTPGTISSASSTEDVFCQGRRGIQEDSTDDDQSFTLEYIPNLKIVLINDTTIPQLHCNRRGIPGGSHKTASAKDFGI
ncbi:hypothetical protein QE152_g38302 [Popillia japonica]|uniref:Uncharacterized protein n=1 Tax=Popillia japonica TaxID=7064 RepID=A0AAW1I6B9_POPJA